MDSEICETKNSGWSDVALDIVWPSDMVAKKKRKLQYKSIAVFALGSVLFFKFGREIADLVYDAAALEDHIKKGVNII